MGLQSAAPEEKRCGLALDESLFDDEMAELGMAAFSEAPLFERLAQIFQHAGAAAQHDAIGLDVQRRQADVVEQLLRRGEVGDASPIAGRLGSRLNTISWLRTSSAAQSERSLALLPPPMQAGRAWACWVAHWLQL